MSQVSNCETLSSHGPTTFWIFVNNEWLQAYCYRHRCRLTSTIYSRAARGPSQVQVVQALRLRLLLDRKADSHAYTRSHHRRRERMSACTHVHCHACDSSTRSNITYGGVRFQTISHPVVLGCTLASSNPYIAYAHSQSFHFLESNGRYCCGEFHIGTIVLDPLSVSELMRRCLAPPLSDALFVFQTLTERFTPPMHHGTLHIYLLLIRSVRFRARNSQRAPPWSSHPRPTPITITRPSIPS